MTDSDRAGHDRDELRAAIYAARTAAELVIAENAEAQRQFVWAQQNRLGLLYVHGFSGVTVGLLMLLFGTPANFEELMGLWVRSALAAAGMVGGGLVLYGLTRRPLRNIAAEAIGMSVLALWDVAIVVSFVLVLRDQPPHLVAPWHELERTSTRVYPVAVYATLLALLTLHVYTLRGLLALSPKSSGTRSR